MLLHSGLARTMYVRYFCRYLLNMVTYGVYIPIRFWPTLVMLNL
jgi:hypothetical protein